MSTIMRKYDWAVYGTTLFYLLVAVYIHIASLHNPYTGLLFQENAGAWFVSSVDPAGHSAEWNIRIGDQLVAVDGESPRNLFKLGNQSYLKHPESLMFMRDDLGTFEILNHVKSSDVYKGLFTSIAELTLLSIGLLAYRKKPESHMVRRFFALNVAMAATLLSVYSTETMLTELILPFVISWLPYLLFAFFISFVFRSVPRWLEIMMAAYRVIAALFAAYALVIFSLAVIPGWTRSYIHFALFGTILAIFAIAAAYWKAMDRAERNKLLTFIAALAFSLMPYLFLCALPDLLWGEFMSPPDMALTGLIILPASILSLWARQKLIDMRFYLPRLAIHSLFIGLITILIIALVRSGASRTTLLLCGTFALLVFMHQLSIKTLKRQQGRREERLDRQRLEMSIRLAEYRNSRDLLRMPAELIHSITEIEGMVFVWNRDTESVIHGTGVYQELEELITTGKPICREWLEDHAFEQVLDLVVQPGEPVIGYLGLGVKINRTEFTPDELGLIDRVRQETVRLLTNAALLEGLRKARVILPGHQSEYQLMEAQQAKQVQTSYYLHDHVLQNLIFLSRDLEELYDTANYDKQLVAIWLKCLYDTQRDIRLLCDDLYPHIVDQAGLGDALRWLLRTIKENGGPATELMNGLTETLEPLYKITLFRIVRELANNTVKHAKAGKLAIRLWETEDAIHCQVQDDGIGIDPAAASERGFGLVTINSQVAQLKGEIDIDSVIGRGTTVRIRLAKQEGGVRHETAHQGDAAG